MTIPSSAHLKDLKPGKAVTPRIIALNVVAQALVTVAVFAALYAGALNPAYRVTASTLSSVVNGVATIALFVFIDPHLSGMTDDVVEGRLNRADVPPRGGVAGRRAGEETVWPSCCSSRPLR